MTDKEMLMLAYGALKALCHKYNDEAKEVIEVIEEHLWPAKLVLAEQPKEIDL